MKRTARLNLSLEGSLETAIKRARVRLIVLFCGIAVTFLAVAGKTVKLTFFYEPEDIKKISLQIAANTEKTKVASEKFRKSIYDRNGILISSSLTTSSLWVNPKQITEPEKNAAALAKILPDIGYAEILKKFKDTEKSFVWIKRNLHPRQKYKINELGIPALQFEDEEKRIYPHGRLFAHAIGMVGQDGHGLSGLEKYLDELPEDNYDKALEGKNITTTLDIRVQNILHDELMKQKEKFKSFTASGVVMDANNGEILAMVSLPDYDPNLPGNMQPQSLFNTITLSDYELGSVFKPFTFSAAFDTGKINESDSFDASSALVIGKFKISDFHAKNRVLTVPEILMYSSNIGTGRIALLVGQEKMREYFKRFGFYDKLDIELVEKSKPNLPKHWSEVTTVTTAYGHGLALSPLHVATAFCAVVNGGLYYQPTLIKRDKDQIITQPRRVISQKTSDRMRNLLRLVVIGGSGTKAEVDGYMIGGKTGTAEKIEPNGHYSKDKKISSFIGTFPINAPKYVVFVVFDDPKGNAESHGFATGGWVGAPVVANVIKRMAPIVKVKPQDEDTAAIKAKYNIVKASD